MADIALTSGAIQANGSDLLLTWTDASWSGTPVVDTDDFTSVVVAGVDGRTHTYDTTVTAVDLTGNDLTITVRVDGWVSRGEVVTLNLAAGFIVVGSDQTGAESSTALTNSSTQYLWISLDDLGTQVGITSPTSDEYDELARHARSAASRIALALGMPDGIHKATHTEDFDGHNHVEHLLSYWPIVSITTVKYRDVNGDLTTIPSDDYRTKAANGRLRRLSGTNTDYAWNTSLDDMPRISSSRMRRSVWREGFQNYEAIYVAGYTPQTLPDSLKGGGTKVASIAYNQSGSDTSLTSESLGDYSYTRKAEDQISVEVSRIVAPFARREVV